jgi:hypothetical protein
LLEESLQVQPILKGKRIKLGLLLEGRNINTFAGIFKNHHNELCATFKLGHMNSNATLSFEGWMIQKQRRRCL